jgi:serine/threonine protein phosphatase PrpC
VLGSPSRQRHTVASLEALVKRANAELYRWAAQERRLTGMGTTVTVAQVMTGELLLAHVGDSRAYRFRAGQLDRLTRDHAVAAELEAAGEITSDEAAVHPLRHVITRSVGPFESVRVDLLGIAWHAADRLLLCSDGLYDVVSNEEMTNILHEYRGDAAVEALIAAALREGAPDNVTAVLAEDDGSEPAYGR